MNSIPKTHFYKCTLTEVLFLSLFPPRLNELMTLLDSGLEMGTEEESEDSHCLTEFGEKLKTSIHNFNLDFIPHMEEEEQVKGGRMGRGTG